MAGKGAANGSLRARATDGERGRDPPASAAGPPITPMSRSPLSGRGQLDGSDDSAFLFESLVARFIGRNGVSVQSGSGFGSTALRVHNRIFAMPVDTGIAVKLAAEDVAEWIQSDRGLPFTAGKARPLREWVLIPLTSHANWADAAEAAYAFGSAKPLKR